MSTTCRILINLRLDRKVADTLLESLRPDNVQVPAGMSISMRYQDGNAEFDICGTIRQTIGTADEMLAHSQVALDVVQ